MSAALATQQDSSTLSNGTHPDISLGSLVSGFSTPARSLRIPSSSSHTTAPSSAPISTPSPPAGPVFSHRKGESTSISRRLNTLNQFDDDGQEIEGGDLLDTPGADKKKWGDAPETPMATRPKRNARASVGGTKGTTLTLRDQEKHIDNLKKENFNIKLRVHFLEERLAQLAPDQIDAALKQNINLKIEVQQRGMEMKKLKKLVLELERELDRLQRGAGGSRNRERELEEKLEERDREIRELRRRRAGQGIDDEAFRELEARNAELQEDLDNARGLLEESTDEIDRLRDIVERRGDESVAEAGGEGRRERLKRRVDELEGENEELRARLDEHMEIITQKEDEKEDLADEVHGLRLEIEDLQRRRQAESFDRSESRAQILEEREEREAVEDDLNALKDKLAAVMIELQQKEDDIEIKAHEIDDLVAEHQRIVENIDNDWRGEVEEARGQVEELRDVLAERESESKELRLNISELEANTNDLHSKFETALAHLEEEAEQKDAEIDSMNQAMEKLSEQIYLLEDENDRFKEETDRQRDDDEAERERLETLAAALKEKITSLKSQLQEMTEMYEACSAEIHAHRSRQEELARHVEDLVEEVNRERQGRERAEADLEVADKEHDDELRRSRRTLEGKESALQSALADLARTQSLLSQRESDLQAVQGALQTLEAESKRAGETHTTARFSLQLEADRLKRDLERVEDELARARKELDERENKGRDRDGALDKLHAENRDLASQLAAQTQARLNLSEKLDGVQASLRTAEGEVAAYKVKAAELEQRLSKDQRSLLAAESQYRDQLTERNTLLLTIYQYLDKILGVDKTPKKSGQAETKPFTNFSVFHDNLITRLKALSQIQLDFDKKCKEIESRFMEKMNDMRKQLDSRWKQIDKFEASVKSYADLKAQWRRRFAVKEGELEALKTTNTEMAIQLSGIKKPGQSESMEVRSLNARVANAERRYNNSQNQLVATEERNADMKQKIIVAETKWEARVKEYEARLKASEERWKRERQGGKERAGELENTLKSLQRQFELAQKRSQQLAEVIELNKGAGSATPK
ncbi:Anucleate primary sterigmata protein B [Hypsizygus marmoreus]|uniref:Anucleate primary sterigmata protein B n=1 Tax=Hypsizygus marmoreus TaxID=39966 RepID=A0A369K4B4_HYPMA|nr:Anucleate primary sterigmata protein B [Hypsizygus marmoreus]